MPEDLRDLSPEMQQRAVKRRAFLSMACGTALVLIFSGMFCLRPIVPLFYVRDHGPP